MAKPFKELTSYLVALGVDKVPHSKTRFLSHLIGVYTDLKEWGAPSTYPHYSWGWTHATNTPFRRWKREVARGGTSDLCIVHWPTGIKSKGDIRHQFVHAIDLVPTVLDALKAKSPTSINGVAQNPLEGVSFAATFDNAKAPLPREAQYFEMFAQRAIYLDGWRAYAPWKFGDNITAKDLT